MDILRENLIIEVQTKNFSALKEKLQILTTNQQVRLVYPLVERKWITYVTKNNIVIDRRKSPRKGVLTEVSSVISAFDINISYAQIETTNMVATCNFIIDVSDLHQLNQVISAIKQLSFVKSVVRLRQ